MNIHSIYRKKSKVNNQTDITSIHALTKCVHMKYCVNYRKCVKRTLVIFIK